MRPRAAGTEPAPAKGAARAAQDVANAAQQAQPLERRAM